ncbi:hypothetical protein Tco_0676227 [Tanacetum coccineum]
MAALNFASSHNMVAFLDKPTESDGFEQIVDFLNTYPVKTVNGEIQIQALVDKKKVIITETSIRSDLQLEDAESTECLPNATIFKQLTLMGAKTTAWNKFSSTMASAVICLATNQKFNFSKYIFNNMVKNLEGGVKFLMYPSGPTEPVTDDTKNVASVPTHSNDQLLSGEDRLKLTELMELCTKLSERVLALETTKTNQALEINSLKRRVKKLEGKRKSKPPGMKRLFKIGRSAQVVSSKDEGLGDQEDASKQGRKIADIDADAEVTLVDETQGRNDEEMFDTGILDGEEVFAEQDVVEKEVSTAEVATDSTTTKTVNELTLAQTLIEIKGAKPKAVTTAATTAVTRPKARGVAKDKGKAKMVEPEKPLKKKDQIMFDKEVAQKLQAQLDAELEEEEKLTRQRE